MSDQARVVDLSSKERMQVRWCGMIQRCCNPLLPSYKNYGGRGISICKRWMDFDLFLEDMGYPPSWDYSLDRIDVNKDYEPDNVKWSTKSEQSKNRRPWTKTGWVYLTYQGKAMSLRDWAKETDLPLKTIRHRYEREWSDEKILTTPIYTGLEHGGKTQTVAAWAREYGIPRKTLMNRLKKMSLSEALYFKRDWSKHIPRSDNRKITANGETYHVYEWARRLGVTPSAIYVRLKNGWSEYDAVTKAAKPDSRRLMSQEA